MRRMVLQTSRRSLVVPHALRFGLLALGGLLLGHEAVYTVQYGIGAGLTQAMASGGHAYWPIFSTLALSALLVLLARSAWQLTQLRLARASDDAARPAAERGPAGKRVGTGGTPPTAPLIAPPTAPRTYPRELLALWAPLFGVVAIGFTILENLEHFTSHGHVPGLEPIIGPAVPLALPILALVTLALATIGALLRWRIATLEARLARARAGHPARAHADRRPAQAWAVVGAIRATFWSLIRQGPVRAPPSLHSA
jgi:hypothetical protein